MIGSVAVYCWLCEFPGYSIHGLVVRLLELSLWALFWCLVAGLISGFGGRGAVGLRLVVLWCIAGCLGFCGLL